MAIVNRKNVKHPTDLWTSSRIACACANLFGGQPNLMFEEVALDYGQADMVFVSKAMYVTEIEIKISLSDWKADFKKDKWKKERNKIKYFWYAVPHFLADKIPAEVPDYAGIILVKPGEWYDMIDIHRHAKPLKAIKLDEKILRYWQRCYYYRASQRRFRELHNEHSYREIHDDQSIKSTD